MSSVPYTGSIVGNLSLSVCLAATSAASGLAFWYRNPDEGAAPNQLHEFMDRSDILPGVVLSASIATGCAAASVFVSGVASPCLERGSAAAGRAYEWIKRYRCRADGAAAMAFVGVGLATGAARYVPPPYDLVAGGLSAAAGALYLYNKPDAIVPPPPISTSSAPDFDPSGAPMDIESNNPLHVDADFPIEFPEDKTIELKTVGAAFMAMMCKEDHVKKNASAFVNKSGETLKGDFESKGMLYQTRMLKEAYALNNPDRDQHRRELMLHLLKHKFGIGPENKDKGLITEQQEGFRDALKATEGNFQHPAFGALLDSDTMTSLLQKCLKAINTEDKAAAEAAKRLNTGGVRFATPSASSLLPTSCPQTVRYPSSSRIDDGRGWDG